MPPRKTPPPDGAASGRLLLHDRIAHAQSYPFPIPDRSYLYRAGRAEAFSPVALDGRVPVLAAGSNQSPEQLARKYAAFADDHCLIPAERGALHGFDVAYAAKLTGYGSVPATFQTSPGTEVTVFVLWLDERQLARMHETEAMYTYDHLTSIRVTLDDGREIDEAYAYSSVVGCLAHEGAPLALAEIPARNRRFRAIRQAEALALVRDRIAPGMALEDFIAGHLDDRDERTRRAQQMALDALPLDFPRRTLLSL